MKIAFVKQKYVPFGGGETYFEALARACKQRGDEVHLVTASWPGHRTSDYFVHFAEIKRYSRAVRLSSFSQSVEKIIAREQFDVTFSLDRTETQDIWRAGEGAHPVWLSRRREYEPRLQTIFSELTPRQRMLQKLERSCVERTNTIIANSQMVKNDLINIYNLPDEKIAVIYNGVDMTQFSPFGRSDDRLALRSRLKLDSDQQILLFIGSGFRRKGLLEVLQAIRAVPDTILLVSGRDDTAKWLKIARRLGVLKRVRFLPPSLALPELYRAADVTVFPSWFDSFGFVGLESLACGTPLVTTPFAGVSELVVPGTGTVISRPDAIDELTRALKEQLSYAAEQRWAGIADSVQQYSLDNNIRQTLALIDAV